MCIRDRASFQLRQEGFDHQISIPNVLPPEVLLPDSEQFKDFKDSHPEMYRRLKASQTDAIEFRPVEKYHPDIKGRPFRHVWFKTNEKVEVSLPMQHQILAYASDYNLLTTAIMPHNDMKTARKYFLPASIMPFGFIEILELMIGCFMLQTVRVRVMREVFQEEQFSKQMEH